jgi:hypothetical protein
MGAKMGLKAGAAVFGAAIAAAGMWGCGMAGGGPGPSDPILVTLDTTLYHVGDSWGFESVTLKLRSARLLSKTHETFTLVSRKVIAKDRIGFGMDVARSILHFDSNGVPGTPLETLDRIAYVQSGYGLTSADIELPGRDTLAFIKPGQFPDYASLRDTSRSCGQGPEVLSCKTMEYHFLERSKPPDPCYGHQCGGSIIGSGNQKSYYAPAYGLIRYQADHTTNFGYDLSEDARLVSRNGIPVPEFTLPNP